MTHGTLVTVTDGSNSRRALSRSAVWLCSRCCHQWPTTYSGMMIEIDVARVLAPQLADVALHRAHRLAVGRLDHHERHRHSALAPTRRAAGPRTSSAETFTARSVAGAVAWANASARSVGASRFETSTTAWTRAGSATPDAVGAQLVVHLAVVARDRLHRR